jgi:hypothetical protein
MDLDTLHVQWTEATARLNYGEQRVFKDVLALVAEEKKTNLVWGSDYGDSGQSACLVNAAGSMLSKGDGSGVPMQQFGEVVGLYDKLNREYLTRDINTSQHVSPLAAEILLHHFAPLKEAPMETIAKESHFAADQDYVEPTDEEMLGDLLRLLSEDDLPVGNEVQTPFDTHSDENV